jgi:hypothetical protein
VGPPAAAARYARELRSIAPARMHIPAITLRNRIAICDRERSPLKTWLSRYDHRSLQSFGDHIHQRQLRQAHEREHRDTEARGCAL